MKKLHTLVALGALGVVFGGCAAPSVEEADEPEGVAQVDQAIQAGGYEYPVIAAFVRVENRRQNTCTGTLLDPSWLLTTKGCTGNRGLLPNPNVPALAGDLRIDTPPILGRPPGSTIPFTSTVGAEIYWHPTADVALVRTAAPIALGTPNFVRNFYQGTTADWRNARVLCHGMHSARPGDPYSELNAASFVVANVQNGRHELLTGRSLVYNDVAGLEPSDRGGACLSPDGQIIDLISEGQVAPCTGFGCPNRAENVETFREWTLDTMHLAENRRQRAPVRFQNASAVNDCVDLPFGTSQEGGAVNHFSCHTDKNQQFYLEPVVGGGIRVVSAVTGKCLDVPSLSIFDNIVQTSCDPRRAGQLIDVIASGNGVNLRPRNAAYGFACIEIAPSGATQLRTGGCDPAELRQRWTLWTPPPSWQLRSL